MKRKSLDIQWTLGKIDITPDASHLVPDEVNELVKNACVAMIQYGLLPEYYDPEVQPKILAAVVHWEEQLSITAIFDTIQQQHYWRVGLARDIFDLPPQLEILEMSTGALIPRPPDFLLKQWRAEKT